MTKKQIDISNRPIPCIDCGACCRYFIIKFNLKNNPQVPKNKIIEIKQDGYMVGAHLFKGKCTAITGEVGKDSLCSIYVDRPDVCKAFEVWLPDGRQNPRCIKAREFYGMPGHIEYSDAPNSI